MGTAFKRESQEATSDSSCVLNTVQRTPAKPYKSPSNTPAILGESTLIPPRPQTYRLWDCMPSDAPLSGSK